MTSNLDRWSIELLVTSGRICDSHQRRGSPVRVRAAGMASAAAIIAANADGHSLAFCYVSSDFVSEIHVCASDAGWFVFGESASAAVNAYGVQQGHGDDIVALTDASMDITTYLPRWCSLDLMSAMKTVELLLGGENVTTIPISQKYADLGISNPNQ